MITKFGHVAIVGRTNVGKSTLLNALLGEKVAIVSSRPQTTRIRLLGFFTEERGQAVFFDTPGLHKPEFLMNRRMVQAAESALLEADLILAIFEAPGPLGPGDKYFLQQLEGKSAPVIAVINKIDRCDKDALFPLIAELHESGRFAEIIPISALKKDNLEKLKELIFAKLPDGDPRYDPETLTNLTERQTASEIVREKLLELTRQEIPHATHTRTETWEELEDGRLKIGVAIWVDRDSQKGIIIGKKGSMLRAIGEASRKELNELLGRRVHLELFVTVKPEWRDKPSALKELGLG
jgi:GTP-binding protein Era